MAWWEHWYVMIPGILVLWGLGVAIVRAGHQRELRREESYRRKVESGEIKPLPDLPPRLPCPDHRPYRGSRTFACPNCGKD
jgi:hypothetical protein